MSTALEAPPAPGPAQPAAAPVLRVPRPRLVVIGTIALLIGSVLAVYAGTFPSADITFTFGIGPEAPGFTLDPPNTIRALGVIIALCGLVGIFERVTGRWANRALLVGTLLFVPLVLVMSLGLATGSKQTNVIPLFVESLRLGTPIALGALAGLWCERSGVVNIGIEGMMLMSAGVSFTVYAVMNGAQGGLPLAVAVLIAVAVGGLMALLHALLCVTFRTDQIISGVVINLLALGVTSFLRSQVIVPLGQVGGVTLPEISIPLLSDIPVIGPELFVGKPIFFMMFVLFALTTFVIWRTPWGLRVRSTGENPHAVETLGINPLRVRYIAVVIGGLIAGLAGAWFSLETVGSFEDGMTGGRGFIALAALIFGKWRPWPAFGGALLFGFADALGTRVQIFNVSIGAFPIPSQFLQLLPYVVTLIVLAGAIGTASPPAADGRPYQRSR